MPSPSRSSPDPGPRALRRATVLAGIALAALILAMQVRTYAFLTDDAFISFRYARNLVEGHGLVFNPGGERVEGYTNPMWVLVLAGLMAVGFPPEPASLALSIAATAGLFVLVVRFVWTRAPAGREWAALLPAAFLASTRSFAVWATSGLETRLFELLLVAGVLRLVTEVEARDAGRPVRPLAPWLFGLAALTRPDGVLIGGCALLASLGYLGWRGRRIPWADLTRWWPMAALVAANLIFRLAYYGAWLPNTYYAKVGDRLAWSRGLSYVAAFALEYGAILWIPWIVSAVVWHRRRGTPFLPLAIAAAVIPHAVYVVAIGGDHFEYRPLDVYLPLIFVLMAGGALAWASSSVGRWLVPSYAALVIVGLAWLPLRSHREFPAQYLPGFPGPFAGKIEAADRFLDPDRDPLFRMRPLRAAAVAHRDLVRELTASFTAVRQEEHRLFFERAAESARRLEAVLDRGALPRDLHLALDCVGVVPYRTDLRTLDRLGLTDARVARTPFVREVTAHGKYATLEYARERGVDLWSADPVSPVSIAGDNRLESVILRALTEGSEYVAADLGSGVFLLGILPQGQEQARRRMPRVTFRPVGDSAIVASYLGHLVPSFLDSLVAGRVHPIRLHRVGEICVLAGQHRTAATLYRIGTELWPREWRMSWMLTICRNLLGDSEGARASLERAVAILREHGDPAAAQRLISMFQQLPRTVSSSPGPG